MLAIKFSGLLAYLALAFGIVARARPMWRLEGYGDRLINLADPGDEAIPSFAHLFPANEGAGLREIAPQHHEQARTFSSDDPNPLRYLAGYDSGDHRIASFGGRSGVPADAGGDWHPDYHAVLEPQAGFHGDHAVSTYPLFASAKRNFNHYQPADPHLGFQPQLASQPWAHSLQVSSMTPGKAAPSRGRFKKQRLPNAESPIHKSSSERRLDVATQILTERGTDSIPYVTPGASQGKGELLFALDRHLVRQGPGDPAARPMQAFIVQKPTDEARRFVRSRFISQGSESPDRSVEAQWIGEDSSGWPLLDEQVSNWLKFFFRTTTPYIRVARTVKSFMYRQGPLPQASLRPYVVDNHIIFWRKLESFKQSKKRTEGPQFYHGVAIPMEYIELQASKKEKPRSTENNTTYPAYDLGVLMAHLKSREPAA